MKNLLNMSNTPNPQPIPNDEPIFNRPGRRLTEDQKPKTK